MLLFRLLLWPGFPPQFETTAPTTSRQQGAQMMRKSARPVDCSYGHTHAQHVNDPAKTPNANRCATMWVKLAATWRLAMVPPNTLVAGRQGTRDAGSCDRHGMPGFSVLFESIVLWKF